MVVFCGEWGIWWRQSVWDVLVGSLRTNHCEVPSVEDWRATCSSNDLLALRRGYLDRGVLHSDDIMDVRKFNNKAASILSHLGRAGLSLPAANEQFYSLQAALRSMLLKHSRWI